MKFSLFAIATLPFLAVANPTPIEATTPNEDQSVAPPSAQADKVCSNASGREQGCDVDRFNGQRRVAVAPGKTFGARCFAHGMFVDGNDVWDYVPGWNCWVSATWTNIGCENGISLCA
ncbi:hypothetical protein DM02DRAFT_671879 [Periconia macrospinosa]|uniref:Uncharacterized protein n=1 Tax=Periconia macrospinosa TaxID=97972 RepID=A0A2V1DQM6_9PLEO|nr:hypothetical protein DM02DRAFT_671879 [Periconia macrospinosa]